MGRWRFYRRVTVMPGVRLNFSKSGTSWTFGRRGYHVTVGKHGTRRTVGLPGTGLAWTSYSPRHAAHASSGRGGSAQVRRAPASKGATSPRREPSAPREPILPLAKMIWGVILIILGLGLIAVYVGAVFLVAGAIMLVLGLVQRRQPKWIARALIRKAKRSPSLAEDLLDQAVTIDGSDPETLGAAGDWHFQNEHWPRAAKLLKGYLAAAPDDALAEAHLGVAYLNANQPAAAIPALQAARATGHFGEDGQYSLIAALALAFLKKGEPQQALELAKTVPLQRHQLTSGLQQCLFVLGLSFYFLGQPRKAGTDLDRLYAQNPDYPGLLDMKQEVLAGTLTLGKPKAQQATSVALG